MKKILLTVAVLFVALPVFAQTPPKRMALSGKSNISYSQAAKDMQKVGCSVALSLNTDAADYLLEAVVIDYFRKGRTQWQYTLFNADGDVLFSTHTHLSANAMKDVCNFIATQPRNATTSTDAPKPTFDGKNWSCPAGFTVYADEHDAIAGKDFTHCVQDRR